MTWTEGGTQLQVTYGPVGHPKDMRGFLVGDRAPLESLSRTMAYSICGFEKSFLQLCAGWKRSKERRLKLGAEKPMWKLLHGPGERRQKPELGQWQYRWREREELEKVGSPGHGDYLDTGRGGQGFSFISNFPLWLPDNVTLERSDQIEDWKNNGYRFYTPNL